MTDIPSFEWFAVFHGAVHPQFGGWRFDQPIPFKPGGSWQLSIEQSRFSMITKEPQRPPDIDSFRNEVMSYVRGAVDALGFCLGAALMPEFQGAFCSSGEILVPSLTWPALSGFGPDSPLWVKSEDLMPVLNSAIREPLVRSALSDLAMAIDRPDDTNFYAHRAVESIRQLFVDPLTPDDQAKKDESWQRLRKALAMSEDELKSLSGKSFPRRHGEVLPISADERLANLTLARTVVEKFIEHYRQGRYEPPVSKLRPAVTEEPGNAVT